MHVIGVGVGRTGTYSLKLAIEQLGLGPCHHMEEVLHHQSEQVPLWAAAVSGSPDWEAIYRGYESAVDWPTAGFYRELNEAYPSARFVLTVRDPRRWAGSFAETIHKLMSGRDEAPAEMQPWFAMAAPVLERTGFSTDLDLDGLQRAFLAHTEAVRAAIPRERLLVCEVKDGWEPLCEFLDVPVPDGPFPRTNDRADFWDRVAGAA